MDSCPKILGRDALITANLERITQGPVAFIGPPGVGCSAVASSFLDHLLSTGRVNRIVRLRLHALSEWHELIYDIGTQLDVTLPGDDATVAHSVQNGPLLGILLDDADLHPKMTQRLMATLHKARWVLTGRRTHTAQSITVPPLSAEIMRTLFPDASEPVCASGRPGWGVLSAYFQPKDWKHWETDAPKALRDAIALPVGSSAPDHRIARLFARTQGYPMPSRFLTDALGQPVRPEAYTEWFLAHENTIMEGALGIPQSQTLPQCLLVNLARQKTSPYQAALAASYACREWTRRFQAAHALDLIRTVKKAEDLPLWLIGVLQFTEGHAHLSSGSYGRSQKSFDAGYQNMTDRPELQARLALECAQEWVNRGDVTRSQDWLAKVGNWNQGECLRLSASLSRQAGEWLGAAALLDASERAWEPPGAPAGARACIELDRAAVLIARDSLRDAESLLQVVLKTSEASVLTHATAYYRMAEITLKRNPSDAEKWVTEAHNHFRSSGSIAGLSATFRIRGDIAALAGRPHDAVAAWQESARLCARTYDTNALKPILERLVTLEREGLPGPHIQEHQAHLDLLAVLSRK